MLHVIAKSTKTGALLAEFVTESVDMAALESEFKSENDQVFFLIKQINVR